MQLKTKISLVASALLCATTLMAEDYVSVQYVGYDESDNRASISSPAIEISKDFGVDYSLKVGLTADSVSGSSPIWYDTTEYDATTSASTHTRSLNTPVGDIEYAQVDYEDNRKAVSALLTKRFASRDELSVGLNHSTENDYEANELSAEYLHFLGSSKNQSISAGISYQANKVEVSCHENYENYANYDERCDSTTGASELYDINVIAAEIGFTQILDENSLVKVSLFGASEDGYLSNPYMNVVRNRVNSNVDIVAENKPDTRMSYGSTLQYTRALTSTLSSNTTYRLYSDDWGIMSHTLSTEMYYELGSAWILGGGLRYYTQSEADFYKSGYFDNELIASSDERMREFDAIGYKVSADYKISKDLSANLGYSYYDQKDTFNATYYNVGVKYKF